MPLGGFDSRNLRDALRRRPEAAEVVAVRRRGGLGKEDDASGATGGGAPCSSSSSTFGNCSMVKSGRIYVVLGRRWVSAFN